MSLEGWLAVLVAVAIVAAVVFIALTHPAGARNGGSRLRPEVRELVLSWRGLVYEEAQRPGLRDSLVLAVIAKESGGNDSATGSAGEVGLMQLTEGAWQDYRNATGDPDVPTFDDVRPARFNIRVGAWYLAERIEDMGNVREGLRAYNCGTAGAKRNPNCGAEYARTILDVLEPELRGAIA